MTDKILIVDDEEEIVTFIKDSLLMEGYQVLTAFNGSDAINQVNADVSLIILDVMLPDMTGFEICRKIREQLTCPILFLSADGRETSRIEGLMVGGDDYIAKPFSIRELKARIIANLRRAKELEPKNQDHCLMCGNIFINFKKIEVRVNNELIHFTKKEFELLELFSLNPEQVLTKRQIFEKIWGYDNESDILTIVEHIKKIRIKLALHDSQYKYIHTVWGIGYKWSVKND
ncbi:response regulator transcription factor [Bacillus tropicus]|uniref:response regulator transcription factor n=1 Tax=Bacillus TaxID=1386 RepID=UPI0008FE349E|nr:MULTISPECIES: response regulator transcription factor [Bacillus]MCC1485864.1 response regulator transcription factor [Bacillus tropicus]MDA1552539.1 response regulator transcription factor [Bacillus cereus group sp. TH243-3LC]MDA1563198.1 response regulator transcription factor [Bacillus cereus group sp. TH243-1LC]MDA1657355.1 response regulator transcription factor [Bacillus cereus group sp. TH150LC]MDA1860405.1 response regulator transcription factor [Bacillus cereus group sp. BY122LC]